VLLRNDIGQKRNWLAVKLEGITSNRDAIGAEVTIRCLNDTGKITRLMRHVSAGGGYASQNSDRLYFGLGNFTRIESMTVAWPSGETRTFRDMNANQLLHIRENGDVKSYPGTNPWQLTRK
jgi:hypothetical protein